MGGIVRKWRRYEVAYGTPCPGLGAARRGRRFEGYPDLWRWSVEDLDGFWRAIWDYFQIEASAPAAAVLGRRTMPGAQWFPGSRLNFARRARRLRRVYPH